MKIKRYYMEDWLNDSRDLKYNLSSSGCEDFYLKDFLKLINEDWSVFDTIYLGDNETLGSLQLRQEIAKSYSHVNINEIMVTNGTSEALFCLFNELLDKDDEVIVPFPAFQCLFEIPKSIGCKLKYLNLLECDQWRLDVDKLEKMISDKTKLIIINNPHNPFGWTLSDNEIIRIAEIAKKHNAYLLFDEHYRFLPLTEDSKIIPSGYDLCKSILGDHVFATGSIIKCFGIVGIRIGWLLSNQYMLNLCRDYKDYITHTIPEITDRIAYLALKNKEIIISVMKKRIISNLEYLNEIMLRNQQVFEYKKPTGGIVCFPKLKNNINTNDFCEHLLKKYKVSVLPGSSFEIKDHIRINIGVEPLKFQCAMDLVEKCIDDFTKPESIV